MYKVAIIGAGQLGSRHLQGLKGAASPLAITVMDSSVESLKMSKERYDSISAVGEKSINYVTTMNDLPAELDIVIIATGSKPRAAIIKSLLDHSSVQFLVLEKVLFPTLSDYDDISRLLKEKKVRCWVNCPRRMFGMFKQISETINTSIPVYMTYAGDNWGLCCNAIHMIDIFMYLTGEKTFAVETKWLNSDIEESKRSGYIEMTGTLKVTTEKGNELTLISENNFTGEKNFLIENGDNLYSIFEGKGFKLNNREYEYAMPYQSQLTGLLVDELLKTGGCSLSPFELSVSYHKPFIKAMLAKYNELKENSNNKLLPIT